MNFKLKMYKCECNFESNPKIREEKELLEEDLTHKELIEEEPEE
ncbi:MAG: hypothetical protein ACP5OG_00295 [Candidatus Nanoarchaeia archaeon]